MPPARISTQALSRHLLTETPGVRRIVRALRRTVLSTAPHAAESFKFHVLCYFQDDAWFKSIGGNVCMIEIKGGEVLLSFIHGAKVPDPAGLMFGKGKSKRFVRVPSVAFAKSKSVAALVKAASRVDLFE